MGMDIQGKNDAYFRASIWSWPPILDWIRSVIAEEKLPINTDGWEMNDGAGMNDLHMGVLLALCLTKSLIIMKEAGVTEITRELRPDDMSLFFEDKIREAMGPDVTIADPPSRTSVQLEQCAEFVLFLCRAQGEFRIL